MQFLEFISTTTSIFINWFEQFYVDNHPKPYTKAIMSFSSIIVNQHRRYHELTIKGSVFHVNPVTQEVEMISGNETLITFSVIELSEDRIEVKGECKNAAIEEYFQKIVSAIKDRWLENQNFIQTNEKTKQQRMREKEEAIFKYRAKAFTEIKEAHPEWTQARVAMEYNEKYILSHGIDGEIVFDKEANESTVANTYHKMGIKWQRGERTR